jgi:hypothetical protein
MSEFTPGPWRKGDVGEIMLNNKYREIISDDGKIGLVYGIIDQDNKANANLIAAAPELYEALTGLYQSQAVSINEPWDDDRYSVAMEKAEAAIKKARGE